MFVRNTTLLPLFICLWTTALKNPVVDDGTRTMANTVKLTMYCIWIYAIIKSFVNRTRMTLIQWFSGKVKL